MDNLYQQNQAYPNLIILDMDGLIIDTEPFWRKAEIEAFELAGLHFTDDMCRETMGFRCKEVIDYWYRKTPWKQPSKEDVEEYILNKMEDYIRTRGEFMPGVLQLLKNCENRNVPVVIASSSPERLIKATVEKLNIGKFIR